MHAEILMNFCQLIGIDSGRVKKAESPEKYHLNVNVYVKKIKNISDEELEKLVGKFGEAINFWIATTDTSDGPKLLEIYNGEIPNDLEETIGKISQLDDELELRLDLSVDKLSILKQYKLDDDRYNLIFYLYKDNLTKFLRSPLPNLDKNLFKGRYIPTIIIISDASFRYSGPFLTVIGVDNIPIVEEMFTPINQKWRYWANKYYTTSLDSLSWVGFEFKNLTPIHFLCSCLDDKASELDSIISNHLMHLSILYTANRASYDNNIFHASFSSSDRTVTMELDEGEIVNEINLLRKLAIWPYSGKESDKLVIFQNVVARELESGDQKENYKSFVLQLHHLLDEARWHYRRFLDGQIDSHFEQMQMATNYVTEMAREVSKSIESITKGLTDALLATIGVVVLTLLTSLTKSEIQGDIFRYGMIAYAAYILVFQVMYRMSSICHSYILLKKETDERLEDYALKLGRKKVDTLSSPFARRKKQFRIWFSVTVAIYILVFILILYLGDILPQYLSQFESVSLSSNPINSTFNAINNSTFNNIST